MFSLVGVVLCLLLNCCVAAVVQAMVPVVSQSMVACLKVKSCVSLLCHCQSDLLF